MFGRWNPAPRYWYWFKRMQDRHTAHGIACAFGNNKSGYDRFIKIIGPIPRGMKSPTVGRYDHDLGYVYDWHYRRWNFRWQEKSENSSECAARNGLSRLGGIACKDSPKFNAIRRTRCPHCGKVGRLPPMRRWHFENCQQAPST